LIAFEDSSDTPFSFLFLVLPSQSRDEASGCGKKQSGTSTQEPELLKRVEHDPEDGSRCANKAHPFRPLDARSGSKA